MKIGKKFEMDDSGILNCTHHHRNVCSNYYDGDNWEYLNSEIMKHPESWNPRPIDIKSGWKNNTKVLAEIVSAINDEIFIADESEMMETVDLILEYLKGRYEIKSKQ